ncbi:hypothetical protein [Natrinema marinum]|uniref:hypothetical protein n=1 Tax=Natrinema marinum TaxID=2961598 RepID=UPI0020C8699C|nr:hypothetical protein [Natrinema marinum]
MIDDGSGGASPDSGSGDPPVPVALENRLMGHGLYVTSFAWLDEPTDGPDAVEDGAGFELEYEVVTASPRVSNDEVGTVLRTLRSIADERAWTPGRLEATSLSTDGAVRGRWHVESDWFERLGAELSELVFSERVLRTITDRPTGPDTN